MEKSNKLATISEAVLEESICLPIESPMDVRNADVLHEKYGLKKLENISLSDHMQNWLDQFTANLKSLKIDSSPDAVSQQNNIKKIFESM